MEPEPHPFRRLRSCYGVIHAFIVRFVEVRYRTRRINTCPACSMIVCFFFLWISCLIYQAMKVVVSTHSLILSVPCCRLLSPRFWRVQPDGALVRVTQRRRGMWAKRTQSVGNLNSSRTFIFGDFLFRNWAPDGQKIQQKHWLRAPCVAFWKQETTAIFIH